MAPGCLLLPCVSHEALTRGAQIPFNLVPLPFYDL